MWLVGVNLRSVGFPMIYLFFLFFFLGLLWLRSVVIDWICYDFLGFHMVVINCGFFGYCCGKDQQWIFVVVSVGCFWLKLFYIRGNSPPLRFGGKVFFPFEFGWSVIFPNLKRGDYNYPFILY